MYKQAISFGRLRIPQSRKGRRPISVEKFLQKEKEGTLYKTSSRLRKALKIVESVEADKSVGNAMLEGGLLSALRTALNRPDTIRRFEARLGDELVGELATRNGQVTWSYIPEEYKGMGLGKKLYGESMRRMPGQQLRSDSKVSPEAARVWEGMKRRSGYQVTEAPFLEGQKNLMERIAPYAPANAAFTPQYSAKLPTEAAIKAASAHKDQVPGGNADKNEPSDFSSGQIAKGVKVEMEHTNNRSLAKEIAMDHLKEFPDYYDRLSKMEREAEAAKEAGLVGKVKQLLRPAGPTLHPAKPPTATAGLPAATATSSGIRDIRGLGLPAQSAAPSAPAPSSAPVSPGQKLHPNPNIARVQQRLPEIDRNIRAHEADVAKAQTAAVQNAGSDVNAMLAEMPAVRGGVPHRIAYGMMGYDPKQVQRELLGMWDNTTPIHAARSQMASHAPTMAGAPPPQYAPTQKLGSALARALASYKLASSNQPSSRLFLGTSRGLEQTIEDASPFGFPARERTRYGDAPTRTGGPGEEYPRNESYLSNRQMDVAQKVAEMGRLVRDKDESPTRADVDRDDPVSPRFGFRMVGTDWAGANTPVAGYTAGGPTKIAGLDPHYFMMDEMFKLCAEDVTKEEAEAALRRLQRLEDEKVTPQQVGRAATAGSIGGLLASAASKTVGGELPAAVREAVKEHGVLRAIPKLTGKGARAAAATVAGTAVFGGTAPLIRQKLERDAEKSKLKAYLDSSPHEVGWRRRKDPLVAAIEEKVG